MQVIETELPGVLIVEPKVFGDARGYFIETFQAARYRDAGIACTFVQDNVSASSYGVLRGLHLQHPQGQDKLVHVIEGEVFDVAVDVRYGSPHFGKWAGVTLNGENHRQFFVPKGFAHGFCVTSERAVFAYKCSDLYAPDYELSVAWNDPAIGIDWPIGDPELSVKDRSGQALADIDTSKLPVYVP